MALELRPNCEWCDKDLPPSSLDACICSFECTFCKDCVEGLLHNVCPNCGGGFQARPIRPSREWRNGATVGDRPPSENRKHSPYTKEQVIAFVAEIAPIKPHNR